MEISCRLEPAQQPSVLDILNNRIPNKPYCTNDLTSGLVIRSREHALQRRFIQVNPPAIAFWMLFDIDREGAAFAWEDANLPHPNWTSINPKNAHAHSAWGLETPVSTSDFSRRDPIRYLCAIESAYRTALGADKSFSGLITKNPTHPSWNTIYGGKDLYTLSELAEYVDLRKHLPKSKPEEIGLGRNVTLFDSVRFWAYKQIRCFLDKGFDSWLSAVSEKALNRNGDFKYPLDCQEVFHTASSIAKWVWQKFDLSGSDQRFSELQAFRGRNGGKKGSIASKQAAGAIGGKKGSIASKQAAGAIGGKKGSIASKRISGEISARKRLAAAKVRLEHAFNAAVSSSEKVSVATIAKAAGISRQNIYKYHSEIIEKIRSVTLTSKQAIIR